MKELLTLLEIPAEVIDFTTDGRDEKVSHFLLGAIIAAHSYEELCRVRHRWWAKHGCGDKVTMR